MPTSVSGIWSKRRHGGSHPRMVRAEGSVVRTGFFARGGGPANVRDGAGFTLMEVMVVLLIVGIMLGMATLSFTPDRRHVTEEARRLRQVLLSAAREAVINHQEIGVRFSAVGYQVVVLDATHHWRVPGNDALFRFRSLPDQSHLSLSVEGQRMTLVATSDGPPHIVLSSSGEQTPFRMALRAPTGDAVRLVGELNGALRLSHDTDGHGRQGGLL